MHQGLRWVGLVSALCVSGAGKAQDSAGDMFKFRGFGTLGAVRSSEKNGDFQANFSLPNGAGFTRDLDVRADSRLGLQVNGRFSEAFSGVVQVISEARYDKTFTPYVSMAHLKWQAMPQLAIRAGRIPLPTYLISDYQKVGYSTPWVRPPTEVYQFNPLTFCDGGDVVWKSHLGGMALSVFGLYGTTRADLPAGEGESTFKGKNLITLGLTGEVGSSVWRVAYMQLSATLVDTDLDAPDGPYALLRTLPAAYGGNPALADQFQLRDDRTTYLSLGYSYDPGDWFLMAEVARNGGEENILLHATAGYLTAGWRLGAWTPYLTVAKKQTDSPTKNANPIVQAMIAGGDHAQQSFSAGLRWDCWKNVAIKAQFDQVNHPTGAVGAISNRQPGFKPGESYHLTSVSVNFVF